MLNAMGARIEGAGTSTITVEGVESLSPVAYTTVPDRIVAGTWAMGAVMTRGDVVIERAIADHLMVALDKLTDAGAVVEVLPDGLRVAMDDRPRCVDVVTLPYPGFPTDLQPMAVALAAVSTGTALITENVYDGRFMFVNELVRLGADIRIDGHHAVVRGRERLSSAPVVATDIRAGAGLVLAGLVSDGVTEVQDAYHVDRGYPDFVEQLRGLGAQVERTQRPGLSQLRSRERDGQGPRTLGVLGEDQHVGPVRRREPDGRPDARVGEHRAQRQRRLAAGERRDAGEQLVLGRRRGASGARWCCRTPSA